MHTVRSEKVTINLKINIILDFYITGKHQIIVFDYTINYNVSIDTLSIEFPL